jgi:pimeloyl-ACP methyl ester carboxylesterase
MRIIGTMRSSSVTLATAQHQALTDAIAGMTAEDYMQTVRSIFTEDVREPLKGIDKPTRIVVGEHDPRTPLAESESVRDLVAGSDLQVIPDAAHLSNIDNPEGFRVVAEPFLTHFAD